MTDLDVRSEIRRVLIEAAEKEEAYIKRNPYGPRCQYYRQSESYSAAYRVLARKFK